MADNPYGNAGRNVASPDNGGGAQNRRSSLHSQLSQMITTQSKQLLDLVDKLRKEKEDAEKLIREKDDEIRQLKGKLERMERELETVKNRSSDTVSGGNSVVTPGAGQFRTKTPIFLGMEEGDTLFTFIDRKLRPDRRFNKQCTGIIDKLVRSLQSRESPFNIKRIVKSGSLGKGTSVKNKSDIDLIIFFNGYTSVQALQVEKAGLLQKIKNYIEKDWSDHLLFKDMTPFSVQFYLKITGDNNHEVDLLPAVDITQSGRQLNDIYQEMTELQPPARDAYSCCFSPLQLEFVQATNRVSTPGKVKDLIRLLKNWAKVEEVPVRSYFLELLVVYLWREGGTPQDINIRDYLHKVLKLLVDCKTMAISFTDHYNYQDFIPNLRPPYLLDPANPFRNVAPFSNRETDTVKRKAAIVLGRGWGE